VSQLPSAQCPAGRKTLAGADMAQLAFDLGAVVELVFVVRAGDNPEPSCREVSGAGTRSKELQQTKLQRTRPRR